MAEPHRGKIYVPIDLRNLKKGHEPFIFRLDEDEEPPCTVLEIFDNQAHIEIKLDERALDVLFDANVKNRIELSKHLAFRRGAAGAIRRKR